MKITTLDLPHKFFRELTLCFEDSLVYFVLNANSPKLLDLVEKDVRMTLSLIATPQTPPLMTVQKNWVTTFSDHSEICNEKNN